MGMYMATSIIRQRLSLYFRERVLLHDEEIAASVTLASKLLF